MWILFRQMHTSGDLDMIAEAQLELKKMDLKTFVDEAERAGKGKKDVTGRKIPFEVKEISQAIMKNML